MHMKGAQEHIADFWRGVISAELGVLVWVGMHEVPMGWRILRQQERINTYVRS